MSASAFQLTDEERRRIHAKGEEYRAVMGVLADWRDAAPGVWLYAFQVGHSGPVKIGWTGKPLKRFETLQQANPEPLRMLAVWAGSQQEERAIHLAFPEFRLRGEWFRADPELVDFVRDRGAGYEREDWA
jgi:hypothetical protein